MATGNKTECDVCGVEKKQVNHWWKAKEMADHIRVAKAETPLVQPYKDVCGQSCLHRLVDRWMETGSLEKLPMVQQKEGENGED